MTLRTRLVLGFALLAALILLAIGISATGLRRLQVTQYESQMQRLDSLERSRELAISLFALENPAPDLLQETLLREIDRHFRVMQAADEDTQRLLLSIGAQVGLVAVASLLALALMSPVLQRKVLDPLARLQRFCDTVASGVRHLRIDANGHDEVSQAIRRLNELLDHQNDIEVQMRGLANIEKRRVVALLKAYGRPAALLGMDGEIALSTLPPADEKALAHATTQLRIIQQEILMKGNPSESMNLRTSEGRDFRITPLIAVADTPIAWLATSAT